MTRAEVRTFLEAGVNALLPVPKFGSGLITDFNSLRSNEYPSVWWVTEEGTGAETELGTSAPQDSWPISLVIAKIDKMDSSPQVYEHIVDDCDLIAQQLAYKYRNIVEGYKLVTMTGIGRPSFVKRYADCLTGVNLVFTLNVPNQTNVC